MYKKIQMPFSSCQPQCPQVFLLHRKASPEGRCLQAGAAAASCAAIQPSLPHLPGGYLCFEPLPVQPFLLETASAFGLHLQSAKSIPGSFLHFGVLFCLQHHQARKSCVISLGTEGSQVLIRPPDSKPFKHGIFPSYF